MNPSTEISPNLMLAADHYNRYPGELVTLYLHFVAPAQPAVTLQLAMPRVMQAEIYRLPPEVPSTLPSVIEHDQDLIILIPLDGHFSAGKTYDLEIGARLNTFYADQHLQVETRLVTDEAALLDSAALRLTVFGKGKYLQYLPEIYEGDDFSSRFLMLFESFWKPLSQQIDQIDHYFDPDLTPPIFVPWLASWIGMPVDPSLPLERVRTLLKNALMLFQCRGTLLALKTYLEIYTAGQVHVIERRATNLILGKAATLGMNVALGKNNQPNSLSINVAVSRAELDRTQYSAETYRRKISELVRTLVPAHVHYDVKCEFSVEQP
jgi:phage tail-like protein